MRTGPLEGRKDTVGYLELQVRVLIKVVEMSRDEICAVAKRRHRTHVNIYNLAASQESKLFFLTIKPTQGRQ
jgi:hypothetical protein